MISRAISFFTSFEELKELHGKVVVVMRMVADTAYSSAVSSLLPSLVSMCFISPKNIASGFHLGVFSHFISKGLVSIGEIKLAIWDHVSL